MSLFGSCSAPRLGRCAAASAPGLPPPAAACCMQARLQCSCRVGAAGWLVCRCAAGGGAAPSLPHLRSPLSPPCQPNLPSSVAVVRTQVYLARNKETGQEVVIKMIERGPAVSKHVESELLIHRCAPVACHCSTLLRLLSLVAAVLLLGWPGGMHMCCSSGWPCADAGGAGPAAAAVLWLRRRSSGVAAVIGCCRRLLVLSALLLA